MRLQLKLFGPVRAWRGSQELALGSAQRRTLLAVLAFQANQVVTLSELIDAIWGDRAPTSAKGSIYTYVSSLRAALDPARPPGKTTEVLTSSGPGYSLRMDAESIDVVRFEHLRERARLCQREHDSRGALTALDDALGLYQHDPMDGLAGPFANAQRDRLRELRLEIIERRAKIMLDAGDHQRVLAGLSPFVAEHPTREGLQNLYLLALYRCGRRTEALHVFESIRAVTIEELGAEPGTALTTCYEQIKVDDPALWRGQVTTPRATVTTRRPQVVPPPSFVGRDRELTSIRTSIGRLGEGRGSSLWFEGEPGIGKSALISAGFADAQGFGFAMASADELTRRAPLQVVLDCLEIGVNSPDPRRNEVASAVRNLSFDDEEAIEGAIGLTVDLVAKLCEERPLVLVTDDLHWADPASLEVWRRLAITCAELPLVLIGVTRRAAGDHQLERLRAEIAASDTLIHELGPLSWTEVQDLVAGLTGSTPEPGQLELAQAAAGNPLFVRDIITASAGIERQESAPSGLVIPQAALNAIGRRLGFLSAAASEMLRWAALLDSSFTLADLAVAQGRPAAELGSVLDEVEASGLVISSRGKLSFKHPVVREALYKRTPTAIRLALHRQLAEALAEVGAPVERVAFQLLAAPVQVDKWICEWLAHEVYNLASRSPLSTVRLLQNVNTSGRVPSLLRERLGIATARIMLWLERDLTSEVGQVAARAKTPTVVAEMRWLLAYSSLVHGKADQASKSVREALRDADTPKTWRTMHEALLSRARVGWPVCAPVYEPAALVPAQRTMSVVTPTNSYWVGKWDAPLHELTRRLSGGPTLARHTLSRPMDLRQLSGVVAAIAAHRGQLDDARAHLKSVWTLFPTGEFRTDGTDFIFATNALLAEMQGQPEFAYGQLASLLDFGDEVVCPWMPALVRLAICVGEYDNAKAATLLCEKTPGQEATALRCRALLDEDPLRALNAAARLRAVGNRFGEAQAMEDAAVLLSLAGNATKAEAASRIALTGYDELGALLDARRVKQRMLSKTIRTFG
ncbi:BTAD domain-containing putative transcriptional regulator [Amycolatopsis sp. lyj-90]|uniref:BTAD domain-containing putative transcriptional regulator n=1 Tax=Amycolatopsis sp. lyj-90 TaxID=2789285 RepID=UPI0039787765